jgi:hypothetical protein
MSNQVRLEVGDIKLPNVRLSWTPDLGPLAKV